MEIIRETRDLDFSTFRDENLLHMTALDKTRLLPEFVESPFTTVLKININ